MSNDNENIELNEHLSGSDSSGGGGGSGEAPIGEDGLVIGEPKKSVSRSTLIMFAVLVVGAAGLFVMYKQAGPKTAAASVTKENAEAKKTINTFLSGGETSVKSMQEVLKNTQKMMQQFVSYATLPQVPLSELQTNPFRQHAAEAKKDDTAQSEAALKKKQEEERLAIKKGAESLQAQLQSIMCSDSRKACMISGTIYREGQVINEFTLEKVTPQFVVVRNGPYRFQLTLQR